MRAMATQKQKRTPLDSPASDALVQIARERLDDDAAGALAVSLGGVRQVRSALRRAGCADGAAPQVEAALRKWEEASSAAASFLEGTASASAEAASASAFEALRHADAAYHEAKQAGLLSAPPDKRPLPAYEPTDEDLLLASAAHRAYPDILRRIEEEPAQLLKLGIS